MNNDPKKQFTREDLKQPTGTTLNQNSDGTAKSDRLIKWEQDLVDIANEFLPKLPVKPPTKEDEEEDD